MSKSVGKSVTRVDAYEKATGRAKYVADLCDQSALVARILHATIAHGYVKSIDTTEAEAVPGVVKVLTCFNVPDYRFPTAGHPWSTDPAHQDVADRLLRSGRAEGHGAGCPTDPRGLPRQCSEAHRYPQRRLSDRHPGAGPDPGGGLVRHPHCPALPH